MFTRRRFLQTSLASTAALALPMPLLAIDDDLEDKPGGAMHLGLVTYLWGKDWKLPDLILNCAKAGVAGVELRTTHAHGVEPALSDDQRAEVRAMFEDSPVECVGPGSNEKFDHADPEKLRAAIETTKAFVKLSHDIGGHGVKVKPDSWQKDVDRAKTIEQVGKSLAEIGDYAQGFGQEIRVEVHGSIGTDFPALKQIMEIADHPSVRYCWNSNNNDLKGAGLDANFAMIKPWFGRTVHVHELNVGDYPYSKLMELLAREDYDGWILLECGTAPVDRLAAMIEQKKIFGDMLTAARKKI